MRKTKAYVILCALILMLMSGGCGGGGSGIGDDGGGGGGGGGSGGSPVTEILTAEIERFSLDWGSQEWQLGMGTTDKEIHPLLQLKMNVAVSVSRPLLTADDEIWVSARLVGSEGDVPLGEASIGADTLNNPDDWNEDGTITVDLWPAADMTPGTYSSLRVEFGAPGETAKLSGTTEFTVSGPVVVLDPENSAQIAERWTETEIQTAPPQVEATETSEPKEGEVVSRLTPMTDEEVAAAGPAMDMRADPRSGFKYYYGPDPVNSFMDRSVSASGPTGYHASVNFNIRLLSRSGRVAYLEISTRDGLSLWDDGQKSFVSVYRWEGQRVTSLAEDGTPEVAPGFSSGLNGMTLTVGGTGSIPEGLTVADISFTVKAYDADGNKLPGEVEGATDETMTRAVANAARLAEGRAGARASLEPGGLIEYPLILPKDPRRVDLPIMTKNRNIGYYQLNNWSMWVDTLWGEYGENIDFGSLGRADYSAVGLRNIDGNAYGETRYFASAWYILFEQYYGMVARRSSGGELRTHDVIGVTGARSYAVVAAWAGNQQFKILSAVSEFRSQVQGVTMSKRQGSTDIYKLLSRADGDGARIDRLKEQTTMRSEFTAEVIVLGKTVIAPYLLCDNVTPYERKYTDYDLFRVSIGPSIPSINFAIITVGGGINASLYVKLQLSNVVRPRDDGIDGEGRIALIPGAEVTVWLEAGFNVWVASANASLKCRLLWAEFQPSCTMEGGVEWYMKHGTTPMLRSKWLIKVFLDMVIGTLNIHFNAKVYSFGIKVAEVDCSYAGRELKSRVWDGGPVIGSFVWLVGYDFYKRITGAGFTPDEIEIR
jgi:hypothetical protein